jgi:hypothetical protein
LNRRLRIAFFLSLLAAVAVVRIVWNYRQAAQGFDEPCHVAAAIEWLDRGTYTLDPVHPPLTRVAIGIPLYLAGKRFPAFATGDPRRENYNDVGNAILYGEGSYQRNLILARIGVLPFLVLEIVLVWLWTRREYGEFAAWAAAALFSTLPIVLAFGGMAYTDVPTSCMQFATFSAFTSWLDRRSLPSSLWLGIAIGAAVLCKLTSLLFLPVGAAFILAGKWLVDRRVQAGERMRLSQWCKLASLTLVIAVLVVWAGYGFSVGGVQQGMQLAPNSIPSFQHFPPVVAGIARRAVIDNWRIPAPALWRGVALAWVLNKEAPAAYLLGKIKSGGWWYFFLLAAVVKTPLPFMMLALAGALVILARARDLRWSAFAPLLCVSAVLLITMPVKYNAGLRHVLVIFPLLSMVAGKGVAALWNSRGSWTNVSRIVLAGLLVWQLAASLSARHDYLAYFNPLAGRDPSRVLIAGCDLDCGQDIWRLSQALSARGVQHVSLAVWSSSDLPQMGLPPFDVLQPFQPVDGWVAVSLRSMRFGDVLHQTYPPDALAWLDRYEPVARVGQTILLYHIPETSSR